MALTLEEALNQKEQNVDVMPKNITMQQASEIDTWDSLIYGQNRPNIVTVGSYKENPFERFSKGVYASLDSSIKDTIPAIQLGLSNADMAIGGYFGADEEVIKRKQANIATIQRNLLASQKERYKNITPQTAESWAFGLGQGAANLLTMYMTGGAAGGLAKLGLMGATKAATAQAVTGIATGVALENIEQQSERIPVNEQGDVDIEKITPEWAKKASIGASAYLATSALLEKYVGFGKQTTMWQTPIKFSNKTLKNMSPALIQAGKGLLSEGATEGLQSLASTGILLAEGTIKMSEMPERLQQAWKEAVIGGILGGSVGVAVGINQQNNVKKMLNEEISKVVADPQERENIVDAIWEAGTNEMTTVISKELELSSELNAKHGSIYDNMSGAIAQAMANSGAFVNESEADIAQYVSETAKMFANQVLAEANKRGCYIDEVLKAGDIAYMDGKIQLKAGDKVLAETPVIGDEEAAQETKQLRLFQSATSAGANENEVAEAEKEYAEKGTESSYFKKWFGKSKVVDALLRPLIVFHGSVQNFSIFDKEKASAETDMGAGFYFTDNEYDVDDNYYGGGPDFDIKVERLAEKIAGEEDIDYDEAKEKAEEQLRGEDTKFEVYLKMENPVYVGGENETNILENIFDGYDAVNEEDYEDYEDYEQARMELEEEALQTISYELDDALGGLLQYEDIEKARGILFEYIYDGVTLQQLKDRLNEEYFENWETGELVNNEVARRIVEALGYDGIIDSSVSDKFNMNIEAGTTHYIVFNPEQIKSVDNRGTFDAENPNIYYQAMYEEKIANNIIEFYNRIKEKPKDINKVKFPIKNKKLSVPSSVILHSIETHNFTANEWNEIIENIDNIFIANKSKDANAFSNNNYRVGIKTKNNNFYGLVIGINKKDNYIATAFKNNTQNGIEAWVEERGKTLSKVHLEKSTEAPFSKESSDNIIAYIKEQLNPSITEFSQIKGLPKQEREISGYYDAKEVAIKLTEFANYSTIPHELAHYWLDNMWAYTRTGKASSAYMNNFNAMADWLGIKEGQISITRNQHEKFARGYEKYLLQGYAPNGLIQGAFDDYDRWLKRVYKSASQLKVKLSPDAIEFFNTMTTGELPEYTVEETQKEIWEKNLKEAEKTVEETRKIVVEKQTEFSGGINPSNTIPISSDGEQKQSAVFTKQAEMLGIAEELNYNKINIEEQNKKATEFVKNNLEQAERIVKGLENPPADILKNAIFNAYLKQMLAIGNNDAYLDALKTQSLELTRAGQEIASQRGAVENIFDAAFWIRKIENNAKIKLAIKKFGSFADETGENALSQMNEYIEKEINSVLDEFVNATPEERTKIVEKLSKKITSEFGVKAPDKLYQSLYEPSEIRTRTNAYNYIYKVISGDLGISLTKEQANEVISKTTQIQKAIESTRGRGGNPSVLFFKNLSEMENYANSISPSPALEVLTSTVGRGNMLFSIKSLALNIESNILNFLTEATIKRAVNGTMNLAVDPQVIKDYISFSNEVYNASGYQLSSMPELDPTSKILSEKMVSSQGEGKARALGRFFEQTIFKYGLGYPDLIFKDLAFVDTANLLATQYAKGDSKKATEIFKDVVLVEPKTEIGQQIRETAINDALIATYQNKGTFSKLALEIRNAINKGTKSLRLGDLLSPFVKTPANVIGLGLDYTFGGAYALVHFNTIINDFKNGELTETTKKSMRSLSRNGLGLLACFVIASLIDDEDYIPDYALLSPKERELVKLKGGVYNSIKIGDRYYSLDYFGTLGLPLVSILNARRGNDLKEKVFKYVQGAGFQALKLPVVGDLKKLLENTGRTLNQDVDNNIKMLEDAAIDFVSSRSIPAFISDISKMTDEYERDTQNKAFNRLMSKIPVLREQLPAQYNYGTGKAVETQDALSTLFAGARVKEEISNSVINEIDRLADKNTETKITLSKVTKLGKLSTLNDSQKIAAEKEFAKQYSKEVKALIGSYSYKTADDSKKVKMINKVRSKVVERLKRQYGLNKRSK